MTFWFVLRARSIFRFAEPVIAVLAAEGHDVRVSFTLRDDVEDARAVRASGATLEPFAASGLSAPARARELHRTLASYAALRRRWPPLLRDRWLDYLPSRVVRTVRVLDRLGLSALVDSRPVAAVLTRSARLWPVPRELRSQVASIAPDVVVASPLVYPGSNEVDAVRAARRGGVRTVGLVLSWDNLTSKGIFHVRPDRLFVWNDAQRDEALDWHGFPIARVDALGAPAFDYLFEPQRRVPRAQALADLGLPADARYVLYAGSSQILRGPGGELEIVRALHRAIRELEWPREEPPELVARPHPNNPAGWHTLELEGLHVREGARFPMSEDARDELVRMVGHADAVVGLNTSLFIDAAILRVPTVALTLERNPRRDRLPATLVHFRHLAGSGFLEPAADAEEAAAVLLRLRLDGDARAAAREAFVRRFVRPVALDRPAATIVAERLASLR